MFRSDIETSRLTWLLEILTNVFPDGRPSELVLMGLRHPGIVVLASTPWKELIRSWQWSGYNVTLAWLAQRECFRVSVGASCGQSARRFGLGKSFWVFAGRMSCPGPFTMDRSPCIFRSGPVAPDRSPWTVCPRTIDLRKGRGGGRGNVFNEVRQTQTYYLSAPRALAT